MAKSSNVRVRNLATVNGFMVAPVATYNQGKVIASVKAFANKLGKDTKPANGDLVSFTPCVIEAEVDGRYWQGILIEQAIFEYSPAQNLTYKASDITAAEKLFSLGIVTLEQLEAMKVVREQELNADSAKVRFTYDFSEFIWDNKEEAAEIAEVAYKSCER